MWGCYGDGNVEKITLTNSRGCVLAVSTHGARLLSIVVPDRQGNMSDVVLGGRFCEEFTRHGFGPTVGRLAGRQKEGTLTVDGKAYQLTKYVNETHHINGGPKRLTAKLWTVDSITVANENNAKDSSVTLTCESEDGESGYPGNLKVSVTYTLMDAENTVRYEVEATTDAPTAVNIACCPYFNLSGHGNYKVNVPLSIKSHILYLPRCSRYMELDNARIPTSAVIQIDDPADVNDFKSVGGVLARLPVG